MNQVSVQLLRLERHLSEAVKSYDPISMLDLSHTLRIWVEMKSDLAEHYPLVKQKKIFTSASPQKKLTKRLQQLPYLLCYMPGNPVRSYAGNGHIFSAMERICPAIST